MNGPSPLLPASLLHDCSRCAGLCCIAPAFDHRQGFAEDKAAHCACRHLMNDCRCDIHGTLTQAGYPACASFECFGAGPAALGDHPQALDALDEAARTQVFLHYQQLVPLHRALAEHHLACAQRPDLLNHAGRHACEQGLREACTSDDLHLDTHALAEASTAALRQWVRQP